MPGTRVLVKKRVPDSVQDTDLPMMCQRRHRTVFRVAAQFVGQIRKLGAAGFVSNARESSPDVTRPAQVFEIHGTGGSIQIETPGHCPTLVAAPPRRPHPLCLHHGWSTYFPVPDECYRFLENWTSEARRVRCVWCFRHHSVGRLTFSVQPPGQPRRKLKSPNAQVTVNGKTTEYPLAPYDYMAGYPQCNQHGFYYEVEALHRCLAKGYRETPQVRPAPTLYSRSCRCSVQPHLYISSMYSFGCSYRCRRSCSLSCRDSLQEKTAPSGLRAAHARGLVALGDYTSDAV